MRRFVVSLFFFLSLVGCSPQARPLKPFRPITPTPQAIYSNIEDLALDASHAQLFVTPDAFLDQLIRIEGSLAPVETPVCADHKGPLLQWGLIGVNEQGSSLLMNARGFERAVDLVPDGTSFLVDGVWKRYTGALGCGKEPATQTIYFLDVMEILQPNPIVRGGAIAIDDGAVFPRPPGDVEIPPESTEPPQVYPVPSDVTATVSAAAPTAVPAPPTDAEQPEPTRIAPPTPTPSPTRTPQPDVTPSNNSPQATATPTRTPFPTSESTEAPTRTPFPTSASADEATATPTPSRDDEPTLTPTASATPAEDGTPEPTDTPDPDDEPINTATPTPDPDATETPTPDPDATETPTPDPDETPNPAIGTTEPGDGDGLPPTTPTVDPDEYPAPYPSPDS